MRLSGITEVKMTEVKNSSTPKVLKAHKAADIFPMMDADPFSELQKDIKEHGQREPIWVYEGKILDGRNRYKACTNLRKRPLVRQYTGDDPVAFVWSENGVRRHLTKHRLTAIAVEMLPALESEAAKRHGHGATAPGRRMGPRGPKRSRGNKSVENAAKLVGVGASSVFRLRAIKKLDPKLYEDIRSGNSKIPIQTAYRELRGLSKQTGKNRVTVEAKVAALAAKGMTAREIAEKLGKNPDHIHKYAKDAGVKITKAPKFERKPNDLKSVITIVNSCSGLALSARSISLPIEGMSKAQAQELLDTLDSALKSLSKIKRALSNI